MALMIVGTALLPAKVLLAGNYLMANLFGPTHWVDQWRLFVTPKAIVVSINVVIGQVQSSSGNLLDSCDSDLQGQYNLQQAIKPKSRVGIPYLADPHLIHNLQFHAWLEERAREHHY